MYGYILKPLLPDLIGSLDASFSHSVLIPSSFKKKRLLGQLCHLPRKHWKGTDHVHLMQLEEVHWQEGSREPAVFNLESVIRPAPIAAVQRRLRKILTGICSLAVESLPMTGEHVSVWRKKVAPLHGCSALNPLSIMSSGGIVYFNSVEFDILRRYQ